MALSNADHFLLFSILFCIFGYFVLIPQSKINRHYWAYALFPIVLYSLIVGMRYGWGPDYMFYKWRFEHPFAYGREDFGFGTLNEILNSIGFDYVGGFITYSFIFIVASYLLISSFRENKYMIAFLVPSTIMISAFTIRQSVAEAFIMIALFFFEKKKYIWVIIFVVIAGSMHKAAIFMLLVIVPLYYIVKKPFSIKLTIPIFLFVAVFEQSLEAYIISFFDLIIPFISFQQGSYMEAYVEQADNWFGAAAMNDDYRAGFFTFITAVSMEAGIIYVGYRAVHYKYNKFFNAIYNAVIIGMILRRLFIVIEIPRRLVDPLYMLNFIIIGYALYYVGSYDKEKGRLWVYLSFGAIILFTILHAGKFLLASPTYKFIWD